MNDFKINEIIAYRIRELRRASGMTQKDLAIQIKVSSLTISRLETLRIKTTTKETIRNIENIFKVPKGYLSDTTIYDKPDFKIINKFCRICGTKLYPDSVYCHTCGTKIISKI